MFRKITQTGLFFILLILLSGCGALTSAVAASSAPTIVRLPAVTETTSTPTPTASQLPLPSPTAAPATASPTLPSPTPTATAVTPMATPSPSNEAAVAATATPVASLAGRWDFTFGTMSLTQRDMKVEGTYQWYGGADTGQIEGIVIDELNQFQGTWINDRSPNSQSLIRWRMANDYNSFTGAAEGGTTNEQWCGVRSGQPLPAGCGFSGVWQLRFGSPPGVTGQATLVQTGQMVRGTYGDSQGQSGEIEGVIPVQSITEMKLTGAWRNNQGEQDSFEWRLDLTTGRTFQGRRDPGHSEWCGWREGTSERDPCGWVD